MRLFVLPLLLLTTACSTLTVDNEANDSALCEGLRVPVDDLAEALLSNKEKTPDEVIIRGTTVIRGYDSGC